MNLFTLDNRGFLLLHYIILTDRVNLVRRSRSNRICFSADWRCWPCDARSVDKEI